MDTQLNPNIEVYGIPGEVHRCYACENVRAFLTSIEAPFTFFNVINKTSEGIQYERSLITRIASRIGSKSLALHYPVIFINDRHIKSLQELKDVLISLGYDENLFD